MSFGHNKAGNQSGITAVIVEPDGETKLEPLDLSGDPSDLLQRWLG
jgi:hypothetical protein